MQEEEDVAILGSMFLNSPRLCVVAGKKIKMAAPSHPSPRAALHCYLG